jgi:hypothetical protein
MLYPDHLAPPTSSIRLSSNDKGVGIVHELNAVEECHEVGQETG